MKKKLFAFLLAFGLMLSACGAKSSASAVVTAPGAFPEEYAVSMDAAAPNFKSDGNALPEGRKWIITGSVDTETENLEETLSAITKRVSELGGYIENQNSYNGSNYYGGRYRHANLTVRIPEKKLDEFMAAVGEASNVVSTSRNAQDVTLTYVDTESRIAALKVERDRLMELLSDAENMADLLTIESRLTDVNYELERYESRLRSLDNQIDYASIELSVSEVTEYTPVEEPTFGQRITKGFADNLKDLWETIQDIIVFIVTNLPAIALWAVVIFGIVKIVKKIRKKKNA